MARETPSDDDDAGVEPPFEPASLRDEAEGSTTRWTRWCSGWPPSLVARVHRLGPAGHRRSECGRDRGADRRSSPVAAGRSCWRPAASWCSRSGSRSASTDRIPLGKDERRSEFKTISWIAMMFSAGMGIGLMFYGVGEPLSHFASPPPGTVEAGTPAAFDVAMATTLFHWTLHPWAIYAVVGLAIAYSTFRKGRRQLISSTFVPLLGSAAPRVGSAGPSISWRSSPPCSGRRRRWVWAPCRSAAGLSPAGSSTPSAPTCWWSSSWS